MARFPAPAQSAHRSRDVHDALLATAQLLLRPSDRGLAHKETKRRCNVTHLRARAFPEPVPWIDADFCKPHEAREQADYVPDAEFTPESATMLVEAARDAVRRLAELDTTTRHDFAAYLAQSPRK